MKNKNKSNTPIHIAGCLSIAGMACLTAFTVNFVLNDANKRSDDEYWAAFNSNIVTESSVDESSDDTTVTDPVVTEPVEDPSEEPPVEEPEEEPEIVVDDHEEEEITTPDETQGDNGNIGEDDIVGTSFDLTNCSLDSDGNLIYAVQPGDCLSKIANRFSCTINGITAIPENKIANPDLIYTGQKFIIPISDDMMVYAKANL